MPCVISCTVRVPLMSVRRIRAVVARTLRSIGADAATLSVHVVGDRMMRRLNRERRGKDRPTDVLAFSMREGLRIDASKQDWGDVFLCVPQIKRQAKRFSVSAGEECVRMLIHGVLHLGGYDHVKARDAKKMFAIQEGLVRKFEYRNLKSETISNDKNSKSFKT